MFSNINWFNWTAIHLHSGSVLVRKLVLNYPEYLIVVVDKLDYCSSLNNLRPFLLVSNNDGDDDQDADSSQDTSPSTPTTTTATTPSEIPRTHSSDTLNPQDDTDIDPRKGNTRSNPLYPNFVFLEGDIIDVAFIDSTMVEYKINTIYHLAAQTHVDKSFGQSIEFTQNNVLGTHVLLEAARKHFVPPSRKAVGEYEQNQRQGQGGGGETEEGGCAVENRFVFVSTDEVYGECRLGQVPIYFLNFFLVGTKLYLISTPSQTEPSINNFLKIARLQGGRSIGAKQPVFCDQGCSRMYGPGVLQILQSSNHHHSEQQRLWTLPVPRKDLPQVYHAPSLPRLVNVNIRIWTSTTKEEWQ